MGSEGNDVNERISQWIDTHDTFPRDVTVKPGAKLIITRNLDVTRGVVNGTMCTLIAIASHYLVVQVRSEDGEPFFINRIRQKIVTSSGIVYYRYQYPVILGWAMTVHRVQGMTLPKAFIRMDSSFFEYGQCCSQKSLFCNDL